MDWKTTAHAALNGDVRTIPLIDKTLTNEGQCADAKKTGDAFAAHEALIHDNSDAIAANAASIQTLREELGEHGTLIADHTKKIGELEEAKNDIEVLKNGLALSTVTATPVVDTGVNGVEFPCYKIGQLCVIAFKAVTRQEVSANSVIYTGLPKPLCPLYFYAGDFSDIMHQFEVDTEGDYGVIKNVSELTGTNRYEGTVTYIAASDSAV